MLIEIKIFQAEYCLFRFVGLEFFLTDSRRTGTLFVARNFDMRVEIMKTRREKYVPKGVVIGGVIGLIVSAMFLGAGLIVGLLIAQNQCDKIIAESFQEARKESLSDETKEVLSELFLVIVSKKTERGNGFL